MPFSAVWRVGVERKSMGFSKIWWSKSRQIWLRSQFSRCQVLKLPKPKSLMSISLMPKYMVRAEREYL